MEELIIIIDGMGSCNCECVRGLFSSIDNIKYIVEHLSKDDIDTLSKAFTDYDSIDKNRLRNLWYVSEPGYANTPKRMKDCNDFLLGIFPDKDTDISDSTYWGFASFIRAYLIDTTDIIFEGEADDEDFYYYD